MKLKNIIAMISFFLAAVSCSMDDDVLNELAKGDPENSDQTEVLLSLNVSVNDPLTRGAAIEGGGEQESLPVTTCSLILFQGDKIFGVYDEVSVGSEGKLTKNGGGEPTFLVKTGMKYEVYVIGDTKQVFAGCRDRREVESVLFDERDLKAGVKFGKKTFVASEKGSSSVGNAPKENLTIPLINQTAQIRLMEVVGELVEGVSSSNKIEVIGVKLLNQNVCYQLKKTPSAMLISETSTKITANNPYIVVNKKWEEYPGAAPLESFSSFPYNNSAKPVQIQLTFRVGNDKTQTRTYTINRPNKDVEEGREMVNPTGTSYVNAGYIYNLYAKVKLVGDMIVCSVVCYTKDWQQNDYVVELED